MFFFLSKILDVFLSPYTWGLLFVALALPLRRPTRKSARRWRRRRMFGLAGIALLVVFALEPVENALGRRLERMAPSTYRPDVHYDAAILLGGLTIEALTEETGEPAYNGAVERLLTTHRLLAEGRVRYAILTAGAIEAKVPMAIESHVLAKQLADWGIDPARLIIEDKARNTRENAVYTEQIVRERGFARVVMVTSARHMPRAIECFAAVGMTPDTLSTDFRIPAAGPVSMIPRADHLSASTEILRETFGLYVYRWRGYAKPASSATR